MVGVVVEVCCVAVNQSPPPPAVASVGETKGTPSQTTRIQQRVTFWAVKGRPGADFRADFRVDRISFTAQEQRGAVKVAPLSALARLLFP